MPRRSKGKKSGKRRKSEENPGIFKSCLGVFTVTMQSRRNYRQRLFEEISG
jgi:hypothetical protein